MTPEEWLSVHAKAPFHNDESGFPFYYWTVLEQDFEPEDLDFSLPAEIWNHLTQKTTYPNVKMYWTKDDAIADFAQAFKKAGL